MQIRVVFLPHSLAATKFSEGDSHPLIGEVQRILADKGLYRAEINNNFDANTAEAISRFQETDQLPASGNMDPVTYCRLRKAFLSEISPITKARTDSGLLRANILIAKASRQLTLFDGNKPLREFPVAIGKPSTPTPEGDFAIASKILHPGGVLGSRWLGLNFGAYGIHGTNAPWFIGQMISNGCIRMHNAHVEELFFIAGIGTPVFIRN